MPRNVVTNPNGVCPQTMVLSIGTLAGAAVEGVGEGAAAVVLAVPEEVVDAARYVDRGEALLGVDKVGNGAQVAVGKHRLSECVEAASSGKPS